MHMRILLATALLMLGAIDAAATHYAVSHGMAVELNPIMAAAISGLGWAGFWLVKMALTLPITIYMLCGPHPGVVASIPLGAYVLLDLWHATHLWMMI